MVAGGGLGGGPHGAVESKMTAMMAEQEQRFQSMMHQVMTHVMGMQQHVVPPVVDITEEAEMMG